MSQPIQGINPAATRPVATGNAGSIDKARSSTPTNADSSTVEPAAGQPPETVAARAEQVQSAVDRFSEALRQHGTELQITVRDDTPPGRMVVSIVDSETGEVVRQIPPEHVLRLAQNLQDFASGLVNEQA